MERIMIEVAKYVLIITYNKVYYLMNTKLTISLLMKVYPLVNHKLIMII